MVVAIETLKRPARCGECQFWQKTGRVRFSELVGECQRPYPADMPYLPLENAPPLLLCDGVRRNPIIFDKNVGRR